MLARVQAARANLTPETIRDINMHYASGSLDARRDMESSGVIQFGCDLLKRHHQNALPLPVRLSAWRWLQNYVIIDDLDDDREVGVGSPIQYCQKLGIFPLAAQELLVTARTANSNEHVTTAVLSVVAWCAQDPACIPELIALQLHLPAIRFVNDGPDSPFLDQAMAVIRSMTLLPSTRAVLLRDGALACCLPYLHHLDEKESEIAIRRGFRAASVLLRLAGTSPLAQQIIRGNSMLVRRTVDVLSRVLDAGATATVYNMGINPHLITMDLVCVASVRENCAMLVRQTGITPVLIRALDKRGKRNPAMVADICQLFCLLWGADAGLRAVFKDEIHPRLAKLVVNGTSADCREWFVRLCNLDAEARAKKASCGGGASCRAEAAGGASQAQRGEEEDENQIASGNEGWMGVLAHTVRKLEGLLTAAEPVGAATATATAANNRNTDAGGRGMQF